ncbi:MAG: cysteine--tRNA ligase [Gammaproteobacteria bacterium RIFCSPHIGHO2_12_FULL_38_14]|nr:MAG: cysteine--tRNA ligase [Gammaproteobacteria bacterium RIFCSPHIGHO2_12_FULL_38_14]
MLQIYNTLTGQKEVFKPRVADRVGLYVCGVTVYDYCHIGHARTYVSFDVVVRYLQFRGYQVNYVRNITDIDDKIIKRANEQHESYASLTQRMIDAMHEDFDALSLVKPHHEPRATDYIPKMIALIETLLANGSAYIASNGDVYFEVRKYKEYGRLSHHDLESLESGARVEVADVKRDPLDFVLWKMSKPDEPAWSSPWGDGRPGWHIECSAMAIDLLSPHFDIHGGGRDLIFPHHENEIAQSCAATHQAFASVWMHGGFLQIGKEKMSKSLGNFVTIRDALAEYSAETLRYLLIASHYRSPVVYTDQVLLQSKQSLSRFYTALRFLPQDVNPVSASSYEKQFIDAMDDDFNVPVALSVLFELAHEVQRLREKDVNQAAEHGALLKKLGGVLGILQQDPDGFFQSGTEANVEKIEQLIAARNLARSQKNWAEADRIRDELTKMSVMIEDGPTGTTWKYSEK